MNIKKLNEEIEKLNNLDDAWDEEGTTLREYVSARIGHIEDSINSIITNFPELKDSYEYEDIQNQLNNLKQDLNL